MTDKELVLQTLQRAGRMIAENIQARSSEMTGTELYAESSYIPSFKKALLKCNMNKRKKGFVCRSSAGRVVKLLKPYDSDTYTSEPEELPSEWGFQWSTNPADALPFVSLSTSPYGKGDCCTDNGKTYRSKNDNNVWAPSTNPEFWEEV